MKKKHILVCIFVTVCTMLCAIKLTAGAGMLSDFMKEEGGRYRPNGSEPVYVGIFGG